MFLNCLARALLGGLSDESFCALQFLRYQGRFPNLSAPRTFNEKIQWLKLHFRDPLLKQCADKWTVRDFVRHHAGAGVLIPALGNWNSPDDIDFLTLPDRFVLKASHGSGWNIIVRDKATMDVDAVRRRLRNWLKQDFSRVGREWAYENLPATVVCEQYLAGPDGEPPWDYKFHCFHGKPHFIQVDYDRFVDHSRSLYDADWNKLPFALEYPLHQEPSPPPLALEQMLGLAALLSAPFPYVRVDLYEVDGRPLFGELTFYPGKGVERFRPSSFDVEFGALLALNSIHVKS